MPSSVIKTLISVTLSWTLTVAAFPVEGALPTPTLHTSRASRWTLSEAIPAEMTLSESRVLVSPKGLLYRGRAGRLSQRIRSAWTTLGRIPGEFARVLLYSQLGWVIGTGPGAWAYFLSNGRATSLGGNYDGEIRAHWEKVFSSLGDRLPRGARLLDLGTGAMAIPLIAQAVASREGHRFEVHAQDFIQTGPEKAGIQFHRTSLEDLVLLFPDGKPIPPEYFDEITSMWGFEYGMNYDASLRRIRRLLKTKGRFDLIIHHPDSTYVAGSRNRLEENVLLGQTNFFGLMRDFYLGRTEAISQALSKLIIAFTALAQEDGDDTSKKTLLRKVLSQGKEIADSVEGSSTYDIFRRIDRLQAGVDKEVSIWRAMVRQSSQFPADRQSEIAAYFAAYGFDLRACEPFFYTIPKKGKRLAGWNIQLQKTSVDEAALPAKRPSLPNSLSDSRDGEITLHIHTTFRPMEAMRALVLQHGLLMQRLRNIQTIRIQSGPYYDFGITDDESTLTLTVKKDPRGDPAFVQMALSGAVRHWDKEADVMMGYIFPDEAPALGWHVREIAQAANHLLIEEGLFFTLARDTWGGAYAIESLLAAQLESDHLSETDALLTASAWFRGLRHPLRVVLHATRAPDGHIQLMYEGLREPLPEHLRESA